MPRPAPIRAAPRLHGPFHAVGHLQKDLGTIRCARSTPFRSASRRRQGCRRTMVRGPSPQGTARRQPAKPPSRTMRHTSLTGLVASETSSQCLRRSSRAEESQCQVQDGLDRRPGRLCSLIRLGAALPPSPPPRQAPPIPFLTEPARPGASSSGLPVSCAPSRRPDDRATDSPRS